MTIIINTNITIKLLTSDKIFCINKIINEDFLNPLQNDNNRVPKVKIVIDKSAYNKVIISRFL